MACVPHQGLLGRQVKGNEMAQHVLHNADMRNAHKGLVVSRIERDYACNLLIDGIML